MIPTLQQFWSRREKRERALIVAALLLLGLALLWAGLLRPAWQLWRLSPAELEALEQKRAAVHRLHGQARALQAQRRIDAQRGRVALTASVQRLGGQLYTQDQGLRIEFTNVAAADLSHWLHKLKTESGARILRAQMRAVGSGLWSGQLHLELGPA